MEAHLRHLTGARAGRLRPPRAAGAVGARGRGGGGRYTPHLRGRPHLLAAWPGPSGRERRGNGARGHA
eukprot:11199199-Lingulodinium_polyedra.AAC.1